MIRFDRILGILLQLRAGKTVAAGDLARQFEVSRRTIYRDMDALSALGVPLYAERGVDGGFRLLPGFFLPPLMLSRGEAVALVLGLALWRSLRARPFIAELDTAERKLLSQLPDELRQLLADADKIVGFEEPPADLLHPERAASSENQVSAAPAAVSRAGGTFLQAILDQRQVCIQYHSPYRELPQRILAQPLAMFWDRARWYLVGEARYDLALHPDGETQGRKTGIQAWRADRVLDIEAHADAGASRPAFDVRSLMGRRWLAPAMEQWMRESPVTMRLTRKQVTLLERDWYYRHARFEPDDGGMTRMTYGADDCAEVFALLRWLGPGAELIEPRAWRRKYADELRQMLAAHEA